jgi:hypothetical protein
VTAQEPLQGFGDVLEPDLSNARLRSLSLDNHVEVRVTVRVVVPSLLLS